VVNGHVTFYHNSRLLVIYLQAKLKKMNKIFTTLCFALCALSINAQTKNDAEAKKILDAVSAKFKSFKAITAKFTLKVENASGGAIATKSGTVFMKGAKYALNITGQDIFCDGTNVWTVDKASKETTLSKFDNSGSTITPQKLFTNFYDKDFKYRVSNTTATTSEIELTPTDKSKPFHKVVVTVNTKTNTLASTKIFEKTGNRFTYTVTSFAGSADIADTKFTYNPKNYVGYELVDIR
jgi:outer membrane lipoprotein carrier protein